MNECKLHNNPGGDGYCGVSMDSINLTCTCQPESKECQCVKVSNPPPHCCVHKTRGGCGDCQPESKEDYVPCPTGKHHLAPADDLCKDWEEEPIKVKGIYRYGDDKPVYTDGSDWGDDLRNKIYFSGLEEVTNLVKAQKEISYSEGISIGIEEGIKIANQYCKCPKVNIQI